MKMRVAGAAVVLVLAVGAMSGCSEDLFVTSTACASWASYDDPDAAADEADGVVIGRVVEQTGSGTFLGARVSTWHVDVEEWVKGGAAEDTIVVTSAIDTCGPVAPDPLSEVEGEGAVGIFLTYDTDHWVMLNPFQGLVELDPSGAIPAQWPADQLP